MNDCLVVLQARMDSVRLPGKMMLPIMGFPLIEFIIRRIKPLEKHGAKFFLATSKSKSNYPLIKIAKQYQIGVYSGDENDVFSRFYEIKKMNPNIKYFVRICGDNPFVDPKLILELYDFHKLSKNDYSWNNVPRDIFNWPDGFGAEIFSSKSLEISSKLNLSNDEKEHVTECFYKRKIFKSGSYNPNFQYLLNKKIDIDSIKDYNKILKLIGDKNLTLDLSTSDILKLISDD